MYEVPSIGHLVVAHCERDETGGIYPNNAVRPQIIMMVAPAMINWNGLLSTPLVGSTVGPWKLNQTSMGKHQRPIAASSAARFVLLLRIAIRTKTTSIARDVSHTSSEASIAAV